MTKSSEVLGIAYQLLTVRKIRRAAIILTSIVVIALLWFWLRRGAKPTSGVGCKNKLAEILWPQAPKRKAALLAYSNDAFSLEEQYYSYMETMSHMCYHQVHIGPEEEGGWEVCIDSRFEFQSPCLVYSFGVGHDLRFELGIEKMMKCEVHAFDPSMGVEDYQYSEKGHFHNVGIDDEDSYLFKGKWKMRRLTTIMDDLGHAQHDIDYMKLDVEFSEWLALYDMMQSGSLKRVRQLVIEFHTPEMDIHTRPEHHCTWTRQDTLAAMVKILVDLRNAGFSVYYSRPNYRTQFVSGLTQRERLCCYNVHMVNLNHRRNEWKPPPKKPPLHPAKSP